ncbi:three-Cys-motif partner protein TcmP [Hyalangium versicolor]|uniref:three-Cys-motif partner protein TcmP n=1 Tax=Hyalangium versicolor TaxID=2861190 RepID=UPI001CCCA402|nr:three-Cys-motif partner protein TcmP [Hyalangium versicolor]
MDDHSQRGALYEGREQTLVKHFILRKYLERFAYKVGSKWTSITYVDCFSGPWNLKSEKLEDSSFAIALVELRKARATLKKRGRDLQIRCFFIERNRKAFARLEEFAHSTQDALVVPRNSTLEDSIPSILEFVHQGGSDSFPFIFIDPTGWTGFAMDTIRPLLQLRPGEVLINFMTGHIERFVTLEETRESFQALFGSGDFLDELRGKQAQDRQDAAIGFYMRSLQKAGDFKYVCCAMVLHPERARTHFHLIYATRNPAGVEVFKEIERLAMAAMEKARAEAQQRKRERASGQDELFTSEVLHDSTHYESLRERYLSLCREFTRTWLKKQKRARYDDAWARVLRAPMVWEQDLRKWLKTWEAEGLLEIEGRPPGTRVLNREQGIQLVWKGQG